LQLLLILPSILESPFYPNTNEVEAPECLLFRLFDNSKSYPDINITYFEYLYIRAAVKSFLLFCHQYSWQSQTRLPNYLLISLIAHITELIYFYNSLAGKRAGSSKISSRDFFIVKLVSVCSNLNIPVPIGIGTPMIIHSETPWILSCFPKNAASNR
jgi:hypothetical protein